MFAEIVSWFSAELWLVLVPLLPIIFGHAFPIFRSPLRLFTYKAMKIIGWKLANLHFYHRVHGLVRHDLAHRDHHVPCVLVAEYRFSLHFYTCSPSLTPYWTESSSLNLLKSLPKQTFAFDALPLDFCEYICLRILSKLCLVLCTSPNQSGHLLAAFHPYLFVLYQRI